MQKEIQSAAVPYLANQDVLPTKCGEALTDEEFVGLLLMETPKQFIKYRDVGGGVKAPYVETGYVINFLNLLFGPMNWSDEVKSMEVAGNEVNAVVRLTVTRNGKVSYKEQTGTNEIRYRKSDSKPVSLGNNKKGAVSDALKKCASQFGIARDIYWLQEKKTDQQQQQFKYPMKDYQKKRLAELMDSTLFDDMERDGYKKWLEKEPSYYEARERIAHLEKVIVQRKKDAGEEVKNG